MPKNYAVIFIGLG